MRSLQAADVLFALGATHQGPGQAQALINALSVDVEGHFQLHNFDTALQAAGGR